MSKYDNLMKAIDDICKDYKGCKDCPLFIRRSPYTYENLCVMLEDIFRNELKEEKENE